MDINNGEILSLVSIPDFNLNLRENLDDKKFINDGIKVKYLKPYKLIYKQISNNFIPDLSILDYLFHNGFKNFLLNDFNCLIKSSSHFFL